MKGSYTINSEPGNNIARRHRCEVCQLVFECHLCTLSKDHRMHSQTRADTIKDPTMNMFVCEECVISDNSRYVRSNEHESKQGRNVNAVYWDYLTGERVRASDIGKGTDEAVRRKEQREHFIVF